jgi:hypothetical protein
VPNPVAFHVKTDGPEAIRHCISRSERDAG